MRYIKCVIHLACHQKGEIICKYHYFKLKLVTDKNTPCYGHKHVEEHHSWSISLNLALFIITFVHHHEVEYLLFSK